MGFIAVRSLVRWQPAVRVEDGELLSGIGPAKALRPMKNFQRKSAPNDRRVVDLCQLVLTTASIRKYVACISLPLANANYPQALGQKETGQNHQSVRYRTDCLTAIIILAQLWQLDWPDIVQRLFSGLLTNLPDHRKTVVGE